jgi:secretion/DNA translocation related TadE-like protein
VSERGAGSVLAIAAMALVTLVAVVVVAATQIVTARARAIAAADAAALAAAPMTFPPVAGDRSPVDEASTLAHANGARLVSCVCSQVATFEPRQVEVTVAVSVNLPLLGLRWVHASSAAEFVP